MIRAVEKLKNDPAKETNFVILSNSNSVFISTILEASRLYFILLLLITFLQHKQITHLFEEVTTNPAEWDPSGLLKVRRRVDPAGPQHSCEVGCSPNMCKGNCEW